MYLSYSINLHIYKKSFHHILPIHTSWTWVPTVLIIILLLTGYYPHRCIKLWCVLEAGATYVGRVPLSSHSADHVVFQLRHWIINGSSPPPSLDSFPCELYLYSFPLSLFVSNTHRRFFNHMNTLTFFMTVRSGPAYWTILGGHQLLV